MAKCKKCGKTLSFIKVSLLSKRNNSINCEKCKTMLEGDKMQLGLLGGIGGAISGGFGFLAIYSLLHKLELALLFFIITFISLLLFAVIQNQIIKLKVK